MLQAAIADARKKDRDTEGVQQDVKPFDWSYSTDYKSTTHNGESKGKRQATDQSTHPIRMDLLSRPDLILFFDSADLYEDELVENGIGLLSIKVRVMPERLLLLGRFFLRLDSVVARMFA
jgi:type 2A phosphatase activator TIP41